MALCNVTSRADQLAHEQRRKSCTKTDHAFGVLLVVQFLAGIVVALTISPRTWAGSHSSVHVHVIAAVCIGAILISAPLWLIFRRPGSAITRNVIGVAQVLFSALFIHLSAGRIETHFHIFGSLAFLALYRDWRVLVPATAVIAIDHFYRSIYWPQSVFGVLTSGPWRAFEHACWVLFEDGFLIYGCIRSAREIRVMADRQAQLELANEVTEHKIEERTAALAKQTQALQAEVAERKALQSQLLEAQKLESIGQLAAGIAHEINTPAQFVSDNTRFIQGEFHGIMHALDLLVQCHQQHAPSAGDSAEVTQTAQAISELDLDFLRSEIPEAIAQSLDGIERITQIVLAMKDFSHPGAVAKEPADINRAIESTVMVCKNRWKYVSKLDLDLQQDLPPVPCKLAEFNQVVLNLVVNAADAIADRFQGSETLGRILVSSRVSDGCAEIRVTDNGGGIPQEVRDRIFDPFFTTKEVGRGTGQGLAISRDVIVNKHDGELVCESKPGEGTTFVIRLPLAYQEAA